MSDKKPNHEADMKNANKGTPAQTKPTTKVKEIEENN